MTGHKVLSADGQVQKTTFAGSVTVEVNRKTGRYKVAGVKGLGTGKL